MRSGLLTAIVTTAMLAAAGARGGEPVLWDNGPWHGTTSYSNGTRAVLGVRHTVLDDFKVGPGSAGAEIWGLRHFAVWITAPIGSGRDLDIVIRADACGAPGPIVARPTVTAYEEVATGEMFQGFPVYEARTDFEPFVLAPGTWWFDATVVGPGQNDWLGALERSSEAWVNWDDILGLVPTSLVGPASDVAFCVIGVESTVTAPCCLPDGTCEQATTQEGCEAMGGCHQPDHPFGGCSDVDCDETCPPLKACCLGDSSCVDVASRTACDTIAGCTYDAHATCAEVECPRRGACCLPDGTCEVVDVFIACTAIEGRFEVGESCAVCPGPAACCLPDGSCLEGLFAAGCEGAGGASQAGGSTCASVACPPRGACCRFDGMCDDDVLAAMCAASGATFREGASCAEPGVVCRALGACCFYDGTCAEDLVEGECRAQLGAPEAPGVRCADVACPAQGACCLPGDACAQGMVRLECELADGTFLGIGVRCGAEALRLDPLEAHEDGHLGISAARTADIAVIGAPGAIGARGAVYVFRRDHPQPGGWGREVRLSVAGDAFDAFGQAVDASGPVVIVGAPGEDGDGPQAGAAYIFERDGAWSATALLTASDAQAGAKYGSTVAVHGETAVVGAPIHDDLAGKVYVYERGGDGGDGWSEAAAIEADRPTDRFGFAVDVHRDTLVVGVPFDANEFGDNAGTVHVYERDGAGAGIWSRVAQLFASDGAAGDWFGYGVSVHGDAILVGAPNRGAGAVYVFERGGAGDHGGWSEVAIVTGSEPDAIDDFGESIDLDGDVAIVGAENARFLGVTVGAAFLVQRGGDGTWGETARLVAADHERFDFFGSAVALAGDTAVVGARNGDERGRSASGAAYRFDVVRCAGCAEDVDGNGLVGFGDVLRLLTTWGPCPGCPEDIDGNGVVGFGDVLRVLGAWGPCA